MKTVFSHGLQATLTPELKISINGFTNIEDNKMLREAKKVTDNIIMVLIYTSK